MTRPSGAPGRSRFAQCKAERFDGVETDIDDTYAEKTGFRISMRLNERFNETLAHDIHAYGLAWFLKNGVHETRTGYDSFLTDQLGSANPPDGTINEQCWQYDECGGLRPFTRAHKPILNSEYTGKQSAICRKARAFPMATARFTVALDGTVRWHCWG
jgi:hypothetical protein